MTSLHSKSRQAGNYKLGVKLLMLQKAFQNVCLKNVQDRQCQMVMKNTFKVVLFFFSSFEDEKNLGNTLYQNQ